ncbi:cytochrome P450 [Durotheca rogersii]|uniref:cytochrome P450 n=1 Tax=Durotheca rogersii TaxID=419775 RepID=UPI00221F6EFF|nr:cytochrome P450 [Durotheca rogersii]KAI5863926.1 cytochrome P450 [Durotheca rogersii]
MLTIVLATNCTGPVSNIIGFVTNGQEPELRAYLQTASVVQWFSALIPVNPEVQKRAHEELDRVVGRRRSTPHVASGDYLCDSLTAAQSSNLPNPNQRDDWIFGAGRRVCPGMIVAEREIWLAISRMLWAFELKIVLGHPIDLNGYDALSGRSPVPFKISL